MSFRPFVGGFARAACLVALGFPAWADQALGLAEAQRIAVSRSQQLAANRAAAQAAREMSVAAGQLPDPVLKAGIQNLPVNGPDRFTVGNDFMTMRSIGVMEELTRADKRSLRVERVQRDADRLEAERVEATANVQRDTALAWIDRYFAQQQVEFAQRQLQDAQAELQGAEVAYSAGRGTQAEFFGARAVLATIQDKLRQAQRQAQAAKISLARWVGADGAGRPLGQAPDWLTLADASLLAQGHVLHLPHLAVLSAQVGAAQTEVRQAQANTHPDWTLEAMYSQRGSQYSNMVSIGVSIPLQIDRANRQDREVAARLAALDEARAKYEDALRMHEAEVQVMASDWKAGRERLLQLRADLLAAARQRREAALTAYRTAKGPLTAVLAARREEVDAQLQVLTAEMDTARLWAQLTFLTPDPRALAQEKP